MIELTEFFKTNVTPATNLLAIVRVYTYLLIIYSNLQSLTFP